MNEAMVLEPATPEAAAAGKDLPRLLALLREYATKLLAVIDEAQRRAGWTGVPATFLARVKLLLPPAENLARYASQCHGALAMDYLSKLELELRMAEFEGAILAFADFLGKPRPYLSAP